MNVSNRLHSQIISQLSQLFITDAPFGVETNEIVVSLFSNNELPGISERSQEFKIKCILLLTTLKKPTLLRSVIVDLLSVLSNQLNETVFLYKYNSISLVCYHIFFLKMSQLQVIEDSPHGRYKKVGDIKSSIL